MKDFTFDRFLRIPRLSSLRLSPDGSRLVVSVARPAPDGKKMRTSIWEVDLAGDRPARRLTRSAPGESVGAFLRDGNLLFTSSRPDPEAATDDREEPEEDEEPSTAGGGGDDDEIGRLWLLPATGGEARVLTAPPGGVEDVRTARDADVVVFGAQIFPGSATLAADRARHRARKDAGVEALLFEGFATRYWDHYLGPRERHLFAAALPDGEGRIGEPADLTPAAGAALVDQTYDVTPDGSTIVAALLDWTDLTRVVADIVAIDRATGEQRTLTPSDAWYGDPACSPDGRSVACWRFEMGSPEHAPDGTLWLIDLDSGEGRDVTPQLDLWPQHPTWSPDGEAIYFTADRRGHGSIHRLDVASGELTLLAAEGLLTDMAPTPDGKGLFALRAGPDGPPRVVRYDAHTPEQPGRPVLSFAELDDLELPSTVERVTARASDGTQIDSWLVRPASASADDPAPLLVWVHGGPLSSWNGWSWRWNPHLLAARGYAILLPDPALSTGYGLDFVQRGWGRWGAEPFTDVMAAVDAALERDDLDASRTALMGGSFGGYMANWVAGSTDRFKAIVTHASLWELRGFHGTTDMGPEWEHEFGDPYTDPSRYEEWSPHRLIGQIRSPVLVIHGELDLRVPISEGLRLWTDLSRHGVDAKFLYFPDEHHWVLKPQNARVWYETVIAFLDQHVLGQEWRRPQLL